MLYIVVGCANNNIKNMTDDINHIWNRKWNKGWFCILPGIEYDHAPDLEDMNGLISQVWGVNIRVIFMKLGGLASRMSLVPGSYTGAGGGCKNQFNKIYSLFTIIC